MKTSARAAHLTPSFIACVVLSWCYRLNFIGGFSSTYLHQLSHWTHDDGTTKKRAAPNSEFFHVNDERNQGVTNTTKRTYSKNSAVSRIKQAALHASAVAAIEQQQANMQLKNSFFSNYSPLSSKIEQMKHIKSTVTLRQLTNEIDSQLHRARALPWEQYHNQQRFQNHRPQVSVLPRDSMAAIVTHNHQNDVSNNGWRFGTSTVVYEPNVNMTTTTMQHITAAMSHATIRHVAVVLTKRSIAMNGEHLLTVECARRIQRLVYAIRHENYMPHVIVFVGEKYVNISAPIGDVDATYSDSDLGYNYFINSMCRSVDPLLHRDLTNVTFHLEQLALSNNALANIATYIQGNHIEQWFMQAVSEASATTHETTLLQQNQPPRRRPKLHVQFSLISSDYHLCILNDIHVRSPGQSPLRYFDRWTTSSIIKNITSSSKIKGSELNTHVNSYSGVQLETSWTYMYSTTANLHRRTDSDGKNIESYDVDDDANIAIASFSSICYQRAQDLIPVLHNLRGVVANTEFFQRENYRVLVQARRSLVSGMELLYQQQPSLAAIHKVLTPLQSSHNIPTLQQVNGIDENVNMKQKPNGKPLDLVLEGALLSLGRCLDLVRPAGLLTGSVPAHDFKLALMVLDQAVTQISIACDPDHPVVYENERTERM